MIGLMPADLPEGEGDEPAAASPPPVSLGVIAREWARIGITGFGGPPAHIALLRRLCVQQKRWISEAEFEDGIAATSLIPGPASTQLAIFCAWRLAGTAGAVIGGACFIVPGLIIILALSVLFLAKSPPDWVLGAAAGAGAAVPAVAVSAAISLVPASWKRAGSVRSAQARWVAYVLVSGAAVNFAGQFLVAVLLGCGLVEWLARRRAAPAGNPVLLLPLVAKGAVTAGVLASVAWVAFKVGALSFGGGFVIIPLMQHDAVHTYHWMSNSQFLSAVALGQVTPGPVVQTVAVVGYAAAGVGGGLLASFIAFLPSFVFVLVGGRHFDRFRRNATAQSFLAGSGPAAIGAIGGAAITLGLSLTYIWQVGVLAAAICWLVLLRRGVVSAILAAAGIGVIIALAGGLS